MINPLTAQQLEDTLHTLVKASVLNRDWRRRVRKAHGFAASAPDYRVLALLYLTPYTRWQTAEIAQRCAIRQEAAPHVLLRLQRHEALQYDESGWSLTTFGKELIEA